MTRIELSINVKYLPEWGAWEGIRELVQNGKDAETQFSAPLDISWLNGTLRIENEGAEMDRNVLLFGTSSKQGRSDLIGKFGEGLKLGTLALVRAGHTVKIRTSDEVWTAAIERSDKFDADVLVFDCRGGNEPKKRVRVEISGIAEEVWEVLRERFLFTGKRRKNDRIATDRGTLLLDPQFNGKIFVKGIFVQNRPGMVFGYDFQHATIDRDRCMVQSWDVEYEASRIWADALAMRPDMIDSFHTMVMDNAPDVQGCINYASNMRASTLAAIAARFTKQFGADAMPVANLAESSEVEHLGKRGIVVNAPLNALLEQVLGNKQQQLSSLREEVTKTYSWSELDETARHNLIDAIKLVGAVREGCTLDRVDIVDFRSVTLYGQHKGDRLLLAAKILADRDQTLEVLVHEFAHDAGRDGEKSHVQTIEHLWRDIVKALRS